jgi:hypothetical protein
MRLARLARSRRLPFAFAASLPLVVLAAFAGCGTRTGLLVDEGDSPATPIADAGIDRTTPHPTPRDAGLDVIPPIDVTPPPIDGNFRSNCPDAGATLVYVVTEQNDLYSFYPPDLTFTRIGAIACPSPSGATPFSMTVDRSGIAYVVFTDGNLYRVSTKTAACAATGYIPGQQGYTTFGMGYVADTTDPGETLYVAPDDPRGRAFSGLGLATIDTNAMVLHFVAAFSPAINQPELTGTGDGRLFAWTPNQGTGATGSFLYAIDKTTAKIIGQNALRVGDPNDAFAFAYWGGEFWIFTSQAGPSNVTRYDLATGSEAIVATMPQTIVGAGVSTCAPSP